MLGTGSRPDRLALALGTIGEDEWVMVLLVIIALVPALICAVVLVTRDVRARTPQELRGDWWPDFERQFQAYARTRPHHRRPQS